MKKILIAGAALAALAIGSHTAPAPHHTSTKSAAPAVTHVAAAPAPVAKPKPVVHNAPKPAAPKLHHLHGHYTIHQARNDLSVVGHYSARRLVPVCYFGEYGDSVQGYGPWMVLVNVHGATITSSIGKVFLKTGWIFYDKPWLLGDDVPVCEAD